MNGRRKGKTKGDEEKVDVLRRMGKYDDKESGEARQVEEEA